MGRNVLISGASHGIGAATAIAFAKDGCNVSINYHNNRAGAEETAAECRKYGVDAQIYCADIGCREQAVGMMRDFIEHFGTVDVLINNAGGALKMPKGEFCDMPLDYWDSQIALNLSGAAYLSHEAIKNMKEHNIPGTSARSTAASHGSRERHCHTALARAASRCSRRRSPSRWQSTESASTVSRLV